MFKIYNNTTAKLNLTLKNKTTGEPIDLTQFIGYGVWVYYTEEIVLAKFSKNDIVGFEKLVPIDELLGKIRITLTDQMTKGKEQGELLIQLKVQTNENTAIFSAVTDPLLFASLCPTITSDQDVL